MIDVDEHEEERNTARIYYQILIGSLFLRTFAGNNSCIYMTDEKVRKMIGQNYLYKFEN
jgi:hypothetical protein